MSDVSMAGIGQALSQKSRKVTIGDWVIGANSTTTVINAIKSDGATIDLSANFETDLINAGISFEAPGVNDGAYRFVKAITSAGVITLDEALPSTPAVGDPFTILAQTRVNVTAAENIAQWGGVAVEAADANGVPKEQQAYTEAATGSAVPTHTLQIGGSDGTDLRTLNTDTTGRVILGASTQGIGAVTEASLDNASATPGSAIPAKALQVSGSDGTDARVLATDTTGAIKLAAGTNSIGAVTEASIDGSTGATGSAVPAKTLQIGGSDGTDLRTLATTATGKLNLTTNVVNIANVSEAAATAFGSFTAPHTGTCKIVAASSAAATLSLTGAGQTNALGSLSAKTWAFYDVPVISGQAYSFQVSAAGDVSLIANISTN